MPSHKNRTQSKCREWERDRRNRFNEACVQLAALVSQQFGADTNSTKSAGNLAKIEIIQRAIAFIKELLQHKSQLDAKLLAAQAEVNEYKKADTKSDASTQVNKQLQNTTKGSNIKKVIWREFVRKERRAASNLKVNSTLETWMPKLPKLLPKSLSTEKKGGDKTVILLPATPYILPHRPLVLPPAPPTYLLLDPFNQNSRKTVSTMPRVVSEITKTTMVNNIPIAAYSFPLSIAKNKKTKTQKINISKNSVSTSQIRQLKIVKKSKKPTTKSVKENLISNETKENAPPVISDEQCVTHSEVDVPSREPHANPLPEKEIQDTEKSEPPQSVDKEKVEKDFIKPSVQKLPSNHENLPGSPCTKESMNNDVKINKNPKNVYNLGKKQESDNYIESISHTKLQPISENNKIVSDTATIQQSTLITQERPSDSVNKNKQDKMQSILDSSICDNTVDGGNVRLELAEEFLAASPTAAFLMSFPLVSGVRADSPTEEEHQPIPLPSVPRTLSNTQHKRDQVSREHHHIETFFSKSGDIRKPLQSDTVNTPTLPVNFINKGKPPEKQNTSKTTYISQSLAVTAQSVNEHSFLNLVPAMLNPVTSANESLFSLDFDGSFTKNASTSHSYVNPNNALFKNDPFNSKTNNISVYTSNNLPVGHDYNNFGLYPCAMEKYSNKINKSEYLPADDNFMKIGSARLPYDLDLGLPQKAYEFSTNVSSASNLAKENVFPAVTAYQTSTYNPFNADFHMPLAPATSTSSLSVKKTCIKGNPFYTDTFTNLYSQPSTLWPEEINLYGNNCVNMSKTYNKPQNSNPFSNNSVTHSNYKYNNAYIFDSKGQSFHSNIPKPSKLEVNQLVTEKGSHKKSPSKTHINWMTSESRPSHNNPFDLQHNDSKHTAKTQILGAATSSTLLHNIDYSVGKKQEYMETNFFPISMSNIPSHTNQDDVQLWPSTRPPATAEIGLDAPPINLPTLVGDLALGPHERRKSVDRANRGNNAQSEQTSCNNFLSVTQLMNRSTEAPVTRGQSIVNESQKSAPTRNDFFTYSNSVVEKPPVGHIDTNNVQPCYFFNDSRHNNSTVNIPYVNHANQSKMKSQKVGERAKCHKNNYSTEALLKGANNAHKVPENISSKFSNASQKYPAYAPSQDGQMAQVSHFPCLTEYVDNSYSGSGLYNTGTSTVSNSFYSNLMSGGGGIMSSSYAPSTFTPDFMDYAPAAAPDCNYTYPRFDSFKMKNQSDTSGQVKPTLELPKLSQKESTGKHKAEHTKKEHSKKYSSKKPKICTEIDEWCENSDASLQLKNSKKNTYNPMMEEMTFSNYLVNQGGVHSHHMPELLGYVPTVAPPSRPLNCPTNATRTNFNLSTLFPEIAKKVQ